MVRTVFGLSTRWPNRRQPGVGNLVRRRVRPRQGEGTTGRQAWPGKFRSRVSRKKAGEAAPNASSVSSATSSFPDVSRRATGCWPSASLPARLASAVRWCARLCARLPPSARSRFAAATALSCAARIFRCWASSSRWRLPRSRTPSTTFFRRASVSSGRRCGSPASAPPRRTSRSSGLPSSGSSRPSTIRCAAARRTMPFMPCWSRPAIRRRCRSSTRRSPNCCADPTPSVAS